MLSDVAGHTAPTRVQRRKAWRAFLDEARKVGLTWRQRLIASLYMTTPYFWFQRNVRGPFTSDRSKVRFSQHYHGKVLTASQAEAIVAIDRDIPLRDLEQVVPYQMARNFVLKAPADIVVTECICRHLKGTKDRACGPTQVCLIIGKPISDAIMAFGASYSRRITKEEALELLKEERDRGHLHTAYFKDAMLDRFYSICNCCKCHCMGVWAMTKYKAPFLSPSGYSSCLDRELCTDCGRCTAACPFGALTVVQGSIILDHDRCMGCGLCVDRCPAGALTLARDETKGLPLDVREMIEGSPFAD